MPSVGARLRGRIMAKKTGATTPLTYISFAISKRSRMPCPRAARSQPSRPSAQAAALQDRPRFFSPTRRISLHNTVAAVTRQESEEESTALKSASRSGAATQGGMEFIALARTLSGAVPAGTKPLAARPRKVTSAAQSRMPKMPMRQPASAAFSSRALKMRPKSMGQTT